MPANPSKDYAIFWNDGTYKTYTLKQTDYKKLCEALSEDTPWPRKAVQLSIGVIVLNDIREVIEQKPAPVQKEDGPAIDITMMTAEQREYANNLLREFHVHGVVNPFEDVD